MGLSWFIRKWVCLSDFVWYSCEVLFIYEAMYVFMTYIYIYIYTYIYIYIYIYISYVWLKVLNMYEGISIIDKLILNVPIPILFYSCNFVISF